MVRTPFVAITSLIAIGRPPSGSFCLFRSKALAAFSASSGRKVTIAFTFGFTRSTWAMNARTTSVAESLRDWISRASFRAGVKQISVFNSR